MFHLLLPLHWNVSFHLHMWLENLAPTTQLVPCSMLHLVISFIHLLCCFLKLIVFCLNEWFSKHLVNVVLMSLQFWTCWKWPNWQHHNSICQSVHHMCNVIWHFNSLCSLDRRCSSLRQFNDVHALSLQLLTSWRYAERKTRNKLQVQLLYVIPCLPEICFVQGYFSCRGSHLLCLLLLSSHSPQALGKVLA